jgi:septation ring formation regulator EzrA
MKHREPVLRKLDNIDSNLNKLNLALNQGDREAAREVIESVREQIEQIKLYIENEPIIGNELNRI